MLSRLPKIGAFTLLSLSIAACSSNNHNNNSIKPTPIPNSSSSDAEKAAAIEANRVALVAKAKAAGLTDAQATAYAAANKEATATAAQKALDNLVAEKLAAEKAAAEKAAAEKAAAEKAAAEKAAAEKAAAEKAAAEKAAAEKAAAEKAAAEKAAAEKAAAEKAAAEKAAAEKAAAEKAAAEKAAAEKAAAEKAAAEKAAAEKAAAEKAAAEKAAAEKAAAEKAAAEKAAAEKAAAEKAAAEKAAAEKAAAEKAAAEKAAAIEANRVALLAKAKEAGLTESQATDYAAANKEADAATAQTALDNLVAAKLAAEKAEAERLAAEKAEQERLAAIEANRVALLAKAKAAGLTEAQATDYAAANKEASVEAAQTALDGIVAENKRIADKKLDLFAKAQTAGLDATRAQTFADNNVNTVEDAVVNALTADVAKAVTADKGGTYTGSGLTNDTKVTSQEAGYGQITTPYGTTYTNYTKTKSSVNKTYNQPYSVVIGKGDVTQTVDRYNSSNSSTVSTFKIDKVAGLATLDQNVPTTGKAVYTGGAFSAASDNGKLNYLVDFDKRKGSGDIQGLAEFGTVKLQESDLTKVNLNGKTVTGVNGTAQANDTGTYTLGLFGPNADEIAGKATIAQKEIGFGGQKDAKATLKQVAIDAGLTATRAQAYADAYVDKADAVDALKTAVQTQADDLAKLVAQGTAIGLTDSHAQTYATKNLDTSQEQLKTALNIEALIQATEIQKSFADKNKFSLNDYKNQDINESTLNSEGKYTERKGWNYSYQQPYSMVLGTWLYTYVKDDVNQLQNGSTYNVDIAGFDTKSVAIPTEGKATYTGSGVRLNDSFDLAYNVDFSKQTGSGYLLKASNYGGKINLDEGAISKINLKGNDVVGITSTAKGLDGTTGNYSLGFYGSQAQEISGSVEMNGAGRDYSNYKNANSKYEIGFGGIRGEITK